MRLTIAIPTINRAYCLRRAIDSALAQTAQDVEVLVSNNASTDETRNMLDGLAGESAYRRLRIFHHDRRLPAAAHGTFLMREAQGSYFVGLSDDDWLDPEFAAEVLGLFDEDPALRFVYTRCWMHFEDLLIPSLAAPRKEESVDFLDAYLSGLRQIFWCACVTRVADLLRLGPQPVDRDIGDMYFWSRIALEGPVGCVDRHLAHYTYLGDNLSIGIPAPAWGQETALLMDEMTSGLEALGVASERLAHIRREARRYLARSTANQFLLNAQRGASKRALLTSLRACSVYLRGDPLTSISRVGTALLLPRTALRPLLHAAAARRATSKSDQMHQGKP